MHGFFVDRGKLCMPLQGGDALDQFGYALQQQQHSALQGLSAQDGAATLTHFTATSIARGIGHVPERPAVYVICGGGRHNPTLMSDIRGLLEPLGERVMVAEDMNLNGDSMEAEAWAYLAVRCLYGLPISFPGTTGVSTPLSGGLIARP